MRKQHESGTQQYGIVPTTFHFPRQLHSALKARASVRGVSMLDIVLDGVRLALEDEKYRLSEDDKRILIGA